MTEPMIDATLAKFQHTGIALVALLAATGGSVWLIILAFAVTAAAAVGGPRTSLPIWSYERFIRPLVEPNPSDFEREEPERFGLLLTAIAIAAALVSWNLDSSGLSSALLWIVVVHEFAGGFGLCLVCRLHGLLPSS